MRRTQAGSSAGAAAVFCDSACDGAAWAGSAPDGHRAVRALLQVADNLVVTRLPGALRLHDLCRGLEASARSQDRLACGGRCESCITISPMAKSRN